MCIRDRARVEGTLLAIFFSEGDDVACLTNVCVIGAEGEDWSTFIPEDATADGHILTCDQTPCSTGKSPPAIVPTTTPAISTPQLFATQQAYEVDTSDPTIPQGSATKAVSYTHLDVYKRQEQVVDGDAECVGDRRQ